MRTRVFLFAALAVVAAACAKEQMPAPEVGGEKVVYTATFEENVDTKTTLVAGNKVEWNAGDEIVFFDNATAIKAMTENGGAQASFVLEGLKSSTRHALYPYSADAYFSSSAITVVLPNIQTGMKGSFADDLNLAVAKADGTNLNFKNVCGLIKLTITQENIACVKFAAKESTGLAGRISVKFDGDILPSQLTLRDTNDELTLYPESETFELGTYYFVSLPTEFSGFTISFQKKDLSVASRVGVNAGKIERNRVLNLGEVDKGLTFANVITFADALVKQACIDGGADTDGDGEISFAEAAAVTEAGMIAIKEKMDVNKEQIVSFNELQYFTGFANANGNTVERQFEGYTALKSVVFPKGIPNIATYSCKGCTALEYVGFPEGLVKIYSNAFRDCTSLTEVHIPEGVTTTSSNVFYGCTSLKNAYIPNTLETVGQGMFQGCTALVKLHFDGVNNNMKTINKNAFKGCSLMTLASRNFPRVTSLGEAAFSGCAKIQNVTMPLLTTVPKEAFYGCEAMADAKIEKLASIGESAFYNCKKLKSATYPLVTDIPKEAFYGCAALESAKIENVTSIGEYAFYNCKKLATITYSDQISSIGAYAFSNCAFGTLVLSENMTELADRAYRYLPITTVTVPASITTIKRAFELCASLEYVVMLPTTPPTLTDSDGFMRAKDENNVKTYTTIYVPDESVEAYKAAAEWSELANNILPMSEKK